MDRVGRISRTADWLAICALAACTVSFTGCGSTARPATAKKHAARKAAPKLITIDATPIAGQTGRHPVVPTAYPERSASEQAQSSPGDSYFAADTADDDAPARSDERATVRPDENTLQDSGEEGDSAEGAVHNISRSIAPSQPSREGDADRADEQGEQFLELPWARVRSQTPEMSAILYRADQCVQRGLSLGARGAIYSARTEFVQSLRLIAQAQDSEQQTTLYSTALESGMVAMKDAEDFISRGASGHDLDVGYLIASHRTPILRDCSAGMTALIAQGRYYTYAQEQLAAAAGREMVGSTALYGLGKVTAMMPAGRKSHDTPCFGQAMTYYQAALISSPNNFRAAHELGVLLAESGRLEQSREMFLRVITITPNPATWRNLAYVHDRLGEKQLAAAARAEIGRSKGAAQVAVAKPIVQWVDPKSFAASADGTDGQLAPMPAPKPAPTDKKTAAKPTGVSAILPWRNTTQK